MGLAGAGTTLRGLTAGMFPGRFPGEIDPESGELAYVGAVPPWLSGLVISAVVLFYVFSGGIRGAVWANTLLTIVFIATALVAVWLVARSLGGLEAAAAAVAANAPEHLAREGRFGHLQFASYLLVPLSAGMFPHLFQHWLTARDARAFRQSLVWFPICLAAVWLPCVLIGLWAAGEGIAAPGGNSNAVLAVTVGRLVPLPAVSGLLAAGVLAAIMSGLDSQFVCLGAMFTHDVLRPFVGQERFSDRHWVLISRLFIAGIVVVVYALSLLPQPNIFDLGVWCFSGFAGLVPLLLAALYWKGATRAGALASVLAMSATWLALFYRGMLAPLARGEPIEGEYLVAGMTPVVLVIAAAGLALWLVSLVTAPPPREHVERFFIEPA
jgi:SSS family solute:Na+ symporter